MGLAPDGSAIVYRDTVGGTLRLWLKERNALAPVPLAGTERGSAPFFSPDGRWIAFSETGRLLKVPRGGGSAVTVSDSGGGPTAGVWYEDGTIVFSGRDQDVVYQVNDDGTEHRRLFNADSLGLTVTRIAAIHGTRALLLSGCPNLPCNGSNVLVYDAETGELRQLVEQASGAWHVAPDILVYSRLDGGVFATPFDRRTLTTHGAVVPVMGGAQTGNGLTDIVVGADGTMMYVAGQSNTARPDAQVMWVDRDGRATPVDSNWSGSFVTNGGPALSPDGTRIAVSLVEDVTGNSNLYVKRLPDGPLSRLSFEGSQNIRPVWTPDGRDVVYVSNRAGGKQALWRQRADGGQQAVLLVEEERPVFEGHYTPDGEWLLFRTDDLAAGRGDIYARRLNGDTTTVTLVATQFEETSPIVSPDGRWLAYTSDETGRKEIYVRPFPNTDDGRWLVSSNGGIEPIWSQDGTELWYRTIAGDVLSARIELTEEFLLGERRRLFRLAGALANDDHRYWAAQADGQRFMMILPLNTGTATGGSDLVLVENWFTTIRDAVAAANE